MPQLDSAVVYDGLPISSGGAHGINRLTADQGLQAYRKFLGSCARQGSVEAGFQVHDNTGPPAGPAVLRRLEQAFPARADSYVRTHSVPAARLDEAVALLEEISPQPTDEWGNAAVMLAVHTEFLLLKPTGDGLWPGQGRDRFGGFETPGGAQLGVSSCRLNLTSTRSMGLMLTIPTATDEDLDVIRPWLQDQLPFRLSGKQWIRWTLNKNGRTYRPRRLAAG